MTYGVGIDVSKHWLDIHVHGLGHSARLGNTPAGYGKLQAWLSPHALRLVLLEATGGYAGRDCAATDPTRGRNIGARSCRGVQPAPRGR